MASKKKKNTPLGKHSARNKTSNLGKHAVQNVISDEETVKTENDTQSAPPSKQKESKPKHAPSDSDGVKDTSSAKDEIVSEAEESFVADLPLGPAFEPPVKERKGKKILKVLGIFFGTICGLAVLAYGAGCFFFLDRFWPNTTINNQDVSLMTASESAPLFSEIVSGYQIKVKGQGLSFNLSAEDIDLTVDGDALVKKALEGNEPWKWPLEITRDHDERDKLSVTYDRNVLSQKIQTMVDTHNKTATQPVNATIAFDDATEKFQIVPEQMGTVLDSAAVMRKLDESLVTLHSDVLIEEGELLRPLVGEANTGLQKACNEANGLIKTNLTFTMDGFEVVALNPATISTWVELGDDFQVTLNEEAFNEWTEGVIAGCNTVGTERTYTRPDGKVITVSGGSYGWAVDGDALRNQIREGLSSGQTGTLEVPVWQSGTGFSGIGNQDWGKRYCDVDLSEQYARFYDENGNVVWESPIISGKPGEYSTPTGVYMINTKASPTTLIGKLDPVTKKPEYKTFVTYWMPFVGNAVGLHDATWQSSFGGSRYRNGYGSHGCINLPYSAAESLYGIINSGDPVISHW